MTRWPLSLWRWLSSWFCLQLMIPCSIKTSLWSGTREQIPWLEECCEQKMCGKVWSEIHVTVLNIFIFPTLLYLLHYFVCCNAPISPRIILVPRVPDQYFWLIGRISAKQLGTCGQSRTITWEGLAHSPQSHESRVPKKWSATVFKHVQKQ